MPCSDGYSRSVAEDDYNYTVNRLNDATRAACDLAHQIRKKFPEAWISLAGESVDGKAYKNIPLLSKETTQWVRDHDAMDRKRRRREKKEKHEKELKRKALDKLTPEERAILGLPISLRRKHA